MSHPVVSVIMNCLNGVRYLREAILSVRAQTFKDWELIVYDDGSTDGSARIAASLECPMRLFHGPGSLPLGEARNRAFTKSKGQYLAILDTDDRWRPSKLARQVAYLEAHPDVGMICSDCDLIDAEGRRHGTMFGRTPFPDGHVFHALLRGPNFLAAPTLMMRASWVLAIGGCKAHLRYAELYDLCVRMAARWPVAALPQVLASYRIHSGNRGGTGCKGMTKEVLEVLRRYHGSAGLGQYTREALLWARYGWQIVTDR